MLLASSSFGIVCSLYYRLDTKFFIPSKVYVKNISVCIAIIYGTPPALLLFGVQIESGLSWVKCAGEKCLLNQVTWYYIAICFLSTFAQLNRAIHIVYTYIRFPLILPVYPIEKLLKLKILLYFHITLTIEKKLI